MIVLGEIADKMPAIAEIWRHAIALSIALLAAIVWRKWLALLGMSAAMWWIWITSDYLYGLDSDGIHQEMSDAWINHSFASSFLPLVTAVSVLVIQMLLGRSKAQRSASV